MRLLFLIAAVGFIFSSCVKNNPDPSWLEVNQWTLQSNPNSIMNTGELTSSLTDAWVFIDGKIIGVFEVPFKIPILKSGSVNIQIFPTIKNNGISATKKIYPFMKKYEINATLVQNQTLTLNPVTSYEDATKFWIEDFEDASVKISTDPTSLATLVSGNDPQILKYGNFYGHVVLNSTDSLWLAQTIGTMDLPKGGQEVYLEIDYYNTNSVTTGVMAALPTGNSGNPEIRLNKQDPSTIHWKKIYIDLKEVVSYFSSAQYYEITFEAPFDSGLAQGDICIDNIKVVHF